MGTLHGHGIGLASRGAHQSRQRGIRCEVGCRPRAPYFHSLSGGWILGSWADNSFFTEYAASRAFGAGDPAHALYASYRLTYLATQLGEAVRTDTLVNRFDHHRRFAHQASAGFNFRMPAIPASAGFRHAPGHRLHAGRAGLWKERNRTCHSSWISISA